MASPAIGAGIALMGMEIINLLGGVFIGVPHLLSHVNWIAINYFDAVEFNHLGWEMIHFVDHFFLEGDHEHQE